MPKKCSAHPPSSPSNPGLQGLRSGFRLHGNEFSSQNMSRNAWLKKINPILTFVNFRVFGLKYRNFRPRFDTEDIFLSSSNFLHVILMCVGQFSALLEFH